MTELVNLRDLASRAIHESVKVIAKGVFIGVLTFCALAVGAAAGWTVIPTVAVLLFSDPLFTRKVKLSAPEKPVVGV